MEDLTPDPDEQADGPFLTAWVRHYPRPLDFDACWVCQRERSPGGVSLASLGPPDTLRLCGQHMYGPDAIDWRPILDEARRSRLPTPTGAYLRVFTRHYGPPADLDACWVCGGNGLWLAEISIPQPLGPPTRAWFCDEHHDTVPLNVLQYEAEQALLPAPRRERAPGAGKAGPPVNRFADRDAEIYRQFQAGKTRRELAEEYDQSEGRIKGIVREQRQRGSKQGNPYS
jgi:hypothetical protein